MGDQYTKMELRELAKFLRKVYPGVADQDSLWALIEKTEQLVKGKPDARPSRRRGDTSPSP